MKIEILYPELGTYYGDNGNVSYLSACLKDAEIIKTPNFKCPAFVEGNADLVYLGSLSEGKQLIAIEKLKPYKDVLRQRIEEGVIFIFTGNAMEILGTNIHTESDETIECLGLYDFHSERDVTRRINYLFLGSYGDITIVGNKSQYSLCYGNFDKPFIKKERGLGNNPECEYEGIHDHNLFATYLLGPFLVNNPLFTERIIKMLDPENELAFKEEIMQAYRQRLEEMSHPAMIYALHEH